MRLSQFGHWWFRELASLFPASWRARTLLGGMQTYIESTANGYVVRRFDGGRCVSQQAVDAKPEGEVAWPIAASDKVSLMLHRQQVLCKRVCFPAATEENLEQVIAFELDRLSPFQPDQVSFDYRIVRRLKDKQQLEIDLVLCPKRTLDPLLQSLAKQGIRVASVSLRDQEEGLAWANLLPKGQGRQGWPLARVLNGLLAVLCLVLVAVWLWQPLYLQRLEIRGYEPVLKQARAEAQVVRDLRNGLESLEADASFLIAKQHAKVRKLDILNELTMILPDDTWVQQLQIRGSEVVLQGKSQAAASVVQILEASPLFSEVRFLSPVTADPREGTERFHLSAQLNDEAGNE